MTPQERRLRLESLKEEIQMGYVDEEMIPYLERINRHKFIVTTQSCCGHGEDPEKGGRRAHIDFRTSLDPETVIDRILKPLDRKFSPKLSFSLYGLHCDRLRYCIWLDNREWREQLEFFIQLLDELEGELNG